MRRLDRERQQLELGRLAYVAVTRAKRRLHLVGAAALRGSGEADEPALQQPRADSMLGFLWPAIAADFERRRDALLARGEIARAVPAARPRAACGNLQRLPADFRLDAMALDAWSTRRQPRDATGPIRPEFDWAGQVAIAVGTVVHAELVDRAAPGFVEAGPETLARGRSAALLAAGLPAERLPLAAARVAQALQRVAASPMARHLLDSRHAHAASELALTAMLDGEPVSVQIDRTFVDADGIRWIADWKTGSHEGGDRDAFLASELRRYDGQLARYSAVMRLLDGRAQRVGLYYPLLDAWVEWSPASGGEPPPG
jgi:ATP-dependent exoDNAse (exonuclease V) beta subunit